MGITATDALKRHVPARMTKARDSEILAWAGHDPPACHGGGAFQRLCQSRGTTENESRDAGHLGRELEPLGGDAGIFGDLADNAREPRVAQAFFHRQQHIGIAARLDMDHPVGMEPSKMQRGRKQVAPAQAPEDRAINPRQDPGEEDRRTRIVSEIGAAGDFMEGAHDDTAPGQARIDLVQAERDRLATGTGTFDPRDTGSQILKDDRAMHDIRRHLGG